ncbi:hypothetical protein BDZ89DRAFT_1134817 [Hymenopellis radicata]|nr:hypothetical protein BDZ89DRAFT_1134817 [Hymenopellis radicata]
MEIVEDERGKISTSHDEHADDTVALTEYEFWPLFLLPLSLFSLSSLTRIASLRLGWRWIERKWRIQAQAKELRTREAEIKAREAELENRKKVLASKQNASQSSVPELEARAAAAETQLSRLTAERDGLEEKRAHRLLEEEVHRLTGRVATTVKEEMKLKKGSKRMEKEIPLTEKRTDVWKRLIEYHRPLFETNAAHLAYMSTKLVILKVEQDIETGKLQEAQALLDSAEDKLEKFKGKEREHEVLMAQRKGWDSKMKEEQIKLDTMLSQTKDAKKRVKGMQAIDEKQSLASCGTTLELRVEIAELESELNMLEKKLELYER